MKKTLFFGLLFLALSAGATAANVMSVQLTGSGGARNFPTVTLTLCEPGTQNCQTIPNIAIDTSTSGLRLAHSVVTLHLPSLQNGSAIVAQCQSFDGGDNFWGSVVKADLFLGQEKANSVPVQLVDSGFVGVSACPNANPDITTEGLNGLLGLGPQRTDCDSSLCTGTAHVHYFSCTGASCVSFTAPENLQVGNPVRFLPENHNGLSLQFPEAPAGGASSMVGQLIFGIGRRENNWPQIQTQLPAGADGVFQVQWKGKTFKGMLDSGAPGWGLPADVNIQVCPDAPFLCPQVTQTLQVQLFGPLGQGGFPLQIQIGNADAMVAPNSVFGTLGFSLAGLEEQSFLLGAPFFFGRTTVIAIAGEETPFGLGPWFGF